jgi:methionyl-tRNA formyltransferase
MKLAFFGSPDIARELLESLHKEFPVSLVVSQPDKPVGRKKIVTPTPVSQFAKDQKIPVITPENLDRFTLESVDLAVVVAYGKLIPKKILMMPRFGFINIHYSLLPKYRGASPVQTAILSGDNETGITIIKIDEELDHGDIISQGKVSIGVNDTAESLLQKLTEQAKPLLLETITYIKNNNKLPEITRQNHLLATFTKRITKQDGFIEFETIKKAVSTELSKNSLIIHNKIRAYFPWPNVWTLLPNGKRCKLISSELICHPERSEGSSLHHIDSSRVKRGQNDRITITQIQLEGKKATRDQMMINRLFA